VSPRLGLTLVPRAWPGGLTATSPRLLPVQRVAVRPVRLQSVKEIQPGSLSELKLLTESVAVSQRYSSGMRCVAHGGRPTVTTTTIAPVHCRLKAVDPNTDAALLRLKPVWNFELVLEPRWLGAVMIASGNKPPAELPNRGDYMHNQDIVSHPRGSRRQPGTPLPDLESTLWKC